MVKKSGKIGQNQENRDKIKYGAYFPSKHDIYDRMHQMTQHYNRNLQNIPLLLLFSRQLRFENLRFFLGQSQKIVSRPLIFQNISMKFLRGCTISSCKKSRSVMAIKFFLAELFKKSTRGGGKFAPPTKIGLRFMKGCTRGSIRGFEKD